MDYLEKIVTDFELQSVEGVRDCFEKGVSPNDYYKGKPLIYELIGHYPRGPQFRECIRAFVDYGLQFDDEPLLAVLLNDAALLDKQLQADSSVLEKRYTLKVAFTPIIEASLLHISAEFNHLACAEMLVNHGMDVNIRAGFDEFGFGGHTPVFHTVNQRLNKCMDVMQFLISRSADLTLTVKGLLWGKGYEWETFIPSVNPISYAMMGLLRQFQRTEQDIYKVVSILMKAAYGIDYQPTNIPNAYLK